MGALQFADVPDYAAIIFRQRTTDQALKGGLIERSQEWLSDTAAAYDHRTKTWTFPSGAILTFGYLEAENDRFRYASSEFQYIAFDELTLFKETDYLFLFSRLRRNVGSQVFLRMRAATNPGGPGHAFVKKRFGIGKGGKTSASVIRQGRIFIPSSLADNPSIDAKEYKKSLQNLDPITRRQLFDGDWTDWKGGYFRPENWPFWTDAGEAYSLPEGAYRKLFLKRDCTIMVTVDWASSERKTADYTAIGIYAMTEDGRLLVLEIVNERLRLEDCVPRLARVCRKWRPTLVAVEVGGFQTALALQCRSFREIPEPRRLTHEGKSKLQRALPAITMSENGRIYLPEAAVDEWVDDYTAQLASFTGNDDEFDDMVDITAYACQQCQWLSSGIGFVSQPPQVHVPGRDTFY